MITEPEGQVSKGRFVFSDSVGAIVAWLAPRVEDRNFTIRASPVSAIPKVLFEDDHSLYLNGSAIHLKHHAYMSGDVTVGFKNYDVFHALDAWWNGFFRSRTLHRDIHCLVFTGHNRAITRKASTIEGINF
jgi:hypothetical protein